MLRLRPLSAFNSEGSRTGRDAGSSFLASVLILGFLVGIGTSDPSDEPHDLRERDKEGKEGKREFLFLPFPRQWPATNRRANLKVEIEMMNFKIFKKIATGGPD